MNRHFSDGRRNPPHSAKKLKKSVEMCEVVHTRKKVFPRIAGQASAVFWASKAKSPNRNGCRGQRSDGLPPRCARKLMLCLRHGAPLPSLFVAFDPCTSHAGAGGARSRAISIRMSLNITRDTVTSRCEEMAATPADTCAHAREG